MTHSKNNVVPGLLDLGTLQLAVMKFIWQREEAGHELTKVRDAFAPFYSEQGLAYSTILTVFTRLAKKGWLVKLASAPKATGLYRSSKSRQDVGKQLLNWVADEFFDGNLN